VCKFAVEFSCSEKKVFEKGLDFCLSFYCYMMLDDDKLWRVQKELKVWWKIF